jgi:hypothetical protein
LEISKIFSLSVAARLYLFLISGGGFEIFKIFSVSAAAAQPIGLHLYLQTEFFFLSKRKLRKIVF